MVISNEIAKASSVTGPVSKQKAKVGASPESNVKTSGSSFLYGGQAKLDLAEITNFAGDVEVGMSISGRLVSHEIQSFEKRPTEKLTGKAEG